MSLTHPVTSAVVFAYSQVGVRCLKVLLDAGVHVPLVITHQDDPRENRWFESVAEVAAEYGVPFMTPDDANAQAFIDQASALIGKPDFLFSFYYRHMLKAPWLALPKRGAFNMHGSLLPKYRGRAPVNWAVVHGERETGATLHVMNEKPDNGAIVDQCAVPILLEDDAREVFNKVVVAAEIVMARALPALVEDRARLRPQDLSLGTYFGARKPEDGRIALNAGAKQVHDLVRAVAPPYPGAFVYLGGEKLIIARTRIIAGWAGAQFDTPRIGVADDKVVMVVRDGALQVLQAHYPVSSLALDVARFKQQFGESWQALDF